LSYERMLSEDRNPTKMSRPTEQDETVLQVHCLR